MLIIRKSSVNYNLKLLNNKFIKLITKNTINNLENVEIKKASVKILKLKVLKTIF